VGSWISWAEKSQAAQDCRGSVLRYFQPTRNSQKPSPERESKMTPEELNNVAAELKRLGTELNLTDNQKEQSGRRRRVCTLASVRLSNCTCGFPACSFHEDSRPPRCQKGIKGTFLAPIRLIQSTSLLGRGRTGFSQKELFRPPSSLLIWFPFSS